MATILLGSARLAIAPRTVEMDRANLGAALGVSSLAQVLRLTFGLALHPLERRLICQNRLHPATVKDKRGLTRRGQLKAQGPA